MSMEGGRVDTTPLTSFSSNEKVKENIVDVPAVPNAGTPAVPAQPEYPSGWKLTAIVIGLCLAVFLVSLDRTIVTTAIPSITQDFGFYEDIGWYGSAYLMTTCAFQPLYGRFYTSFATKSTFLIAVATFMIGSLICSLAPSTIPLIVGRAVQGVGGAGISTGSLVIVATSVPLHKRPVLLSTIGILYGCGAAVGPLLGGVFTDLATWRWCFWLNLPVGAVTFIVILVFFHPKQRPLPAGVARPSFIRRVLSLDLISNVILLVACIMLFMALEYPLEGRSWSSARVIGLLVGAGLTFILLAIWQWYMGDKALLPPAIVTQRTVACSCISSFFTYGAMGIHAYFLPIWFEAVRNTSAIHAGVNMIPYMLANSFMGLVAGVFVSKNGYFTPPAIIGCAIGTVGCGLLSILHVYTPSANWIGYEIVVSAGLGMAMQQGYVAVQTALPRAKVPIGTAAVVASQSLGGAIFISVGNTIFQNSLFSEIRGNPVVSGIETSGLTSTGITTFRSMVDAEQLQILLKMYNKSLTSVFVACVPLAGLGSLFSLGLEWKSVKGPKKVIPDAEAPKK